MAEAEKRKYKLSGLDCAVCAEKIRSEVEKLESVEKAEINFFSQELSVKSNHKDAKKLLGEIKAVVTALEPDVELREEGEPEKEADFKADIVKIIISAVLFAAGLTLKFALGLEEFELTAGFIVMLVLFLASYIIVGYEVLFTALRNIAHGKIFDENFLMLLASVGAIAIGEYPEAAAVMLLFQTGELFQSLAVAKSRRSIKALMDIRPDYANLLEDGAERRVNPAEVPVGGIILVKPGERVPIDGVVIEGASSLDASALTGESEPRDVSVDDELYSGSLNLSGVIKVKTTKLFTDSAAAKILKMVEDTDSRKAGTENFITKFAKIYTPIVVAAAAIVSFAIPLLFGLDMAEWVKRGLVFLVISCPCALVISVPLGYFSGIGKASSKGILVKGSGFLDALANASAVVFDKTGTLTKGNFKVTRTEPRGVNADELLELAAYAENYSSHPIAVSIREEYGREIDSARITECGELAGEGISAVIDGKRVLAGNIKLMKHFGIEGEPTDETNVQVAVDGKFAGYIVISDEIKPTSESAVKELRKSGIGKIAMLTGDNGRKAKAVADELKLDCYYAELMPEDKITRVKEMQAELPAKGKLVFAGDGINDAPVLMTADVGVAMGAFGSDAAVEAADVVLMKDDPMQIAEAISIAKKTRRIVIENIVFALAVKLITQVLGLLGIALMWEAVFADVGVCLIAVMNSLRLIKK